MKFSSLLLALGLWASFVLIDNASCYSQTLGNPAAVPVAGFGQPYPGQRYPIIARGAQREMIQNTPIELRPNRPFHFYGNTVRRNHYGYSRLPRGNRF